MIRRIPYCLVWFLLVGGLQGQEFEVPFESEYDRVFVPVVVNGQGPYRFMVDLGASGIGRIDAEIVQTLGLPASGRMDNSDGVNVASMAVVEIAELTLGPITVRGARLGSRDYNSSTRRAPIAGILGREFFADHLLTIDYPAERLRIAEGRLRENDPHVVAYGPSVTIPMSLGGESTVGQVDTGSSLVMHVPLRFAELVATSPLEPGGEGRRANTTFVLYRGTVFDPITLAGSTHDSVTVSFSELAREINIGSGFLKRFVVRVDQVNRLIQLQPR